MIVKLAGWLLIVAGFVYAGYGIVRLLIGNVRPRPSWTLILGAAFGLGLGVVTFGTILAGLLGLRIGIPLFVLCMLPSLIAHLFWRRRIGRAPRPAAEAAGAGSRRGPSLLPAPIAILVLLLAVTVAFIGSVLEPVAEVDAIARWGFHAKVFFFDRSALPEFLTSGAGGDDISHWPPLVPLVQTWTHVGMREYDDRMTKLVFPVIYLAMICLFYGTLRRHRSREIARSITVLLATVPAILVPYPAGSIASAYADVPMALFVTAISCLLFLWIVERHDGSLILAALYAAAILWLKREGIAFALVSTVVVWVFALRGRRQTIGGPLAWTAILATSFLVQVLYKGAFPGPFSGDPIDASLLVSGPGLHRILQCAKAILFEALHPARWGFLWILVGLLIILRIRSLRRRTVLLPLLLLVGQIGMALIGMAVSEYSTARIAALDIRRFLIQLAPLAALALAVIAGIGEEDGPLPDRSAEPLRE